MKDGKQLLIKICISSLISFGYISTAYAEQGDLSTLSVEDLLNVEVISVAKKAKSLNDSPAAIYVISQDDIKRIGATSVPEALRLAPGLDVARIDANKWAVTARGFNGRFANKLLVLIDGRNTYTRAFAGVYWENQDVMLEDVERIEIIRGPGATLWGANAVNGVINIITKHSADTIGGLVAAAGGTEQQAAGAFRYGAELNSDTTARAYVKGFKQDESTHQSGGEAGDDWDKVQGGFRIDSQLSLQDSLTVQGDAYRSVINQNTLFPQTAAPYQSNFNESIDTFGGNVMIKEKHTISATSDYSVQIFYDFYERDEVYLKESRHVIDIDMQHRFGLMDWNDIIWGMGYRYNHDQLDAKIIAQVDTPSRNDQLFSAFIQDEITLLENTLWLTLGSKFEHNDYSGFEVQPTARLMWVPHNKHRLWGAVSRAVRTPSRGESGMNLLQQVQPPQPPTLPVPVAVFLEGDQRYDSEDVVSFELGYRTTFIDNFSVDLTAFYNVYHNLRSAETGAIIFPSVQKPYITQPIFLANYDNAKTYGIEVATVWQMTDWWRWDFNYSLLKMDFSEGVKAATGMSPQQRFSVRSALSPVENIDLDLFFRYVDPSLSTGGFGKQEIKDYVSLDVRMAWRPVKALELSVVGQNLLAEHHMEYRQENLTLPTAIDRGMYGKLAWHF